MNERKIGYIAIWLTIWGIITGLMWNDIFLPVWQYLPIPAGFARYLVGSFVFFVAFLLLLYGGDD